LPIGFPENKGGVIAPLQIIDKMVQGISLLAREAKIFPKRIVERFSGFHRRRGFTGRLTPDPEFPVPESHRSELSRYFPMIWNFMFPMFTPGRRFP